MQTYSYFSDRTARPRSLQFSRSKTGLLVAAFTFLTTMVLSGCGASPQPSYQLQVSSATTVAAGGATQAISVAVERVNGFSGAVNITPPSSLPAGVTITPGLYR